MKWGSRNVGAFDDSNPSDNRRRRRPNHGGSDREAATEALSIGPVAQRDSQSVAQLRKTLNRSTPNGKWADAALVVGAIALGVVITLVLYLALAINARANRLIASDQRRATEGPIIIDRLETKLDNMAADIQRIKDSMPTTTTTVPRRSPTTGTTVRPRSTTTTVRPTTTTTSPPPPPATTPTTRRPCVLALGDLCLL